MKFETIAYSMIGMIIQVCYLYIFDIFHHIYNEVTLKLGFKNYCHGKHEKLSYNNGNKKFL